MKQRGIQALQRERRKILDKIEAKDPKLAQQIKNVEFDWFKIKNSADEDVADLYIYDDIMPAWMAEWIGGVSAEGLIAELNEITAKTINVRINSPGGSVFEAIAIYNALVSHSANINVYVDSLAASAASVVAMSGDTVTMMVGSQMMIHDAMGIEMGNAKEMRAFADFLDSQSDNIASIYADRMNADPAEIRQLMIAETWMTANEAVELGFADKVYERNAQVPPSEEEESEEDAPPKEEEPTETDEEEEEKETENRMIKRHNLTNRGFNYAGRKRAPDPPSSLDTEVDEILALLGSK